MGRFNLVWNTAQRLDPSSAGNMLKRLASIAALVFLYVTTADAFSTDESLNEHTNNSICGFSRMVVGASQSAYVAIDVPGPNGPPSTYYYAGGSVWESNNKVVKTNIINEALMLTCFNDYTPLSLQQKGADPSSFEEQTYMGFGYQSNAGGGWIEYVIGSGTLIATAATDFAAAEDAIRSVITDDATRSLTSILNANERMVGEARERLIASLQEGADLATRDNVPFDVDGTFNLDGNRLSTKGTFFEQRGTADGAGQRLFFGDFDVQHDGDTNSTTATITARMAWEQMYTDSTMLGYFVGGELAHSNIKGSFEGEQDRLGVSFGGYAVHQLDEQVFVDGFITVGAGRNNLEIADATLDLTSDYDTRTATMGAAVSGVYEYGQYDFHPELAFSYGKTWIGDVGFTGVAYGLTDDTLSLDAGDVSIANLTLRPEIVWALDAETVADSNTQLLFAPRFICQRTSAAATAQDCGAGAEIGLSSTSEDGLGSANIRLVMDRVGNSNRSSFALNFERSF